MKNPYGHIFRVESLVKFFLCKEVLLKDDVIDRTVGRKGFLGRVSIEFVSQVTLSMMDSAMTGSMTFT